MAGKFIKNMATITDDELEQEFGLFGVNLDDLVITDKLKEISSVHKWSASHLVEEWIAYSAADVELSLESLEEFKRKISSGHRNRSQISKDSKNEKIYNKSSIEEIITDKDVSILEMYQTPETKTSIKRLHTTPESAKKMLHTLTGRTPITTFSPVNISPVSATPAKRYEARENACEVALTYNPGGVLEKDINWNGHHSNLEIKDVSDKPLTERFKYMFQKILDKSQVLNDYIDKMASLLKKAHKIEEFASISSMHQEDVTVVGRVGCDTNGKLNASSLILRESGSSSSGHSVSLNVAEVNQYSLFPGQVVAVRGKNATGTQFIASSLYEGLLPQPHKSIGSYTDTLSVFIAAGPFTTSESDSYEPLSDFINQVQKENPDLVIMIGPFVDAKHEMIEKCQLNETFDELFSRKMNSIGECAKRLSKKFIIIPSQRDVNHELVYPQPPFVAKDIVNTLISVMHKNKMGQNVNQKERENVTENIEALHFVSDPCTIEVNGCTLGLTSTDVLFQMAGEEISHPPGSSDKMGRLVKHILTQQCYYPLYPPSENVCVDYEVYGQHACLPCKPDVLIVPSELRYFVKNVLGCLSINPGRLTKGLVGGTYCRILLKKDQSLQDVVDRSVVQIVKI